MWNVTVGAGGILLLFMRSGGGIPVRRGPFTINQRKSFSGTLGAKPGEEETRLGKLWTIIPEDRPQKLEHRGDFPELTKRPDTWVKYKEPYQVHEAEQRDALVTVKNPRNTSTNAFQHTPNILLRRTAQDGPIS